MRPRDADLIDGLTPKQLQVLRRIAAFHESECYSPTIAELASRLCLSRSTVFEHLAELQKKSLLSTCPGRARSLRLTPQGQRVLRHLPAEGDDPVEEAVAGVPLLGQVAAGLPVEAVENQESLSFSSCFGSGEDLFALQVRGDSMVEENIRPGDYVICRRAETARNGELVVALIDEGQATLKRFYREQESVRLQPANAHYEPIYSNDCRINAVVVGLLRKF